MAVTISLVGRVANIRTSTQPEVVNFKIGAPIGRKNDQGKYEYVNYDCAAWGSLGTKLIAPYVKEGDYLAVTLELEKVNIWEANGKSGVNQAGKVLNVTLLNQDNVKPANEEAVDELVAATNGAVANPTVSEAAPTNIPF